MAAGSTLDPRTVEDQIKAWWDSGQVEDFRSAFSDRFRQHLPSDARTGRLRTLHQQLGASGLEPNDGFLTMDAVTTTHPLGFLKAGIQEKLASVLRSDGSGGTVTQEEAVLSGEEQLQLTEFYTRFEELAVHYLTDFAPAQSDLVAPYPFLDKVELAETLYLPFRQVVAQVLDGQIPLGQD